MTNPGNEDKRPPAAHLEYPDEAGYPDGTGTLDEGTRANTTAARDEADDSAADADEEAVADADAIEDFAETDAEDE